jgi:hypothetical protein
MAFSPVVPLALVCGCLYYALGTGLPRALAAFDQQVCVCAGGAGGQGSGGTAHCIL